MTRRPTWQFKLTTTQVNGLELINRNELPHRHTLAALMVRDLVDEDLCLTEAGCAYLNEARPGTGATVLSRKEKESDR